MQTSLQQACDEARQHFEKIDAEVEAKKALLEQEIVKMDAGGKDWRKELYRLQEEWRGARRKAKVRARRQLDGFVEVRGLGEYVRLNEEIDRLQEDWMVAANEVSSHEDYFRRRIAELTAVLREHGFCAAVNVGDEGPPSIKNGTSYEGGTRASATTKGIAASHIQEIECLALADALDTRLFDPLTPIEFSTVLSCFVKLKLPDHQCVHSAGELKGTVSDATLGVIQEMVKLGNKYKDVAASVRLPFEEDYMQYNLCELVGEWCVAKSEAECMEIIKKAGSYDILMGEWVKAMMKICNIVNELDRICVLQGNMKLLKTLKEIPDLLMKFIVINQSLYV